MQLEDLKPGGRMHVDYPELLALARAGSTGDVTFGSVIEGEWAWLYERATAGVRDLRTFTVGTFTWLWDTTLAESPSAEARLVGLYGTSVSPSRPRDRSRMAGFPLRQSGKATVHRGHGAGHSLGGPDEGFNLFPQLASVNLSGRWRQLERHAAKNPGTFIFVRCIYGDASSTPAVLEYGQLRVDDRMIVRTFANT